MERNSNHKSHLLLLFGVYALFIVAVVVVNTKRNNKQDHHSSSSSSSSSTKSKPLQVFLMIGQSNMQGHGYIDKKNEYGNYYNGTLPWMIQTYPEKYGKLQKDATTTAITSNSIYNWTVREDVWVAYNRENYLDVHNYIGQYGLLAPGFGGDPGQQGQQMGPELGFGWTLAESWNGNNNNIKHNHNNNKKQQQILLLKLAWGGRSLAVDFRPPSSGGITGLYYEAILAYTYKTLAQLNRFFPDYNGKYQLAGLAWHQGWNDGCDVNMTNEYEFNLVNLIRDVRRDLNVPNLPFVIGVSGFNGYHPDHGRRDAIVAAQLAVANATRYPEFDGTVSSVDTRAFQRGPLPESPGTQVYHWNNNCETYWLIGEAMGHGMLELLSRENADMDLSQEMIW
jgi:hypothetical protein